MSAPARCPMCGESLMWKQVDTQKKGFSVGKAALGGILLGPVGLIGGALGKKKVCGMRVENVVFNMNIMPNLSKV